MTNIEPATVVPSSQGKLWLRVPSRQSTDTRFGVGVHPAGEQSAVLTGEVLPAPIEVRIPGGVRVDVFADRRGCSAVKIN